MCVSHNDPAYVGSDIPFPLGSLSGSEGITTAGGITTRHLEFPRPSTPQAAEEKRLSR